MVLKMLEKKNLVKFSQIKYMEIYIMNFKRLVFWSVCLFVQSL